MGDDIPQFDPEQLTELDALLRQSLATTAPASSLERAEAHWREIQRLSPGPSVGRRRRAAAFLGVVAVAATLLFLILPEGGQRPQPKRQASHTPAAATPPADANQAAAGREANAWERGWLLSRRQSVPARERRRRFTAGLQAAERLCLEPELDLQAAADEYGIAARHVQGGLLRLLKQRQWRHQATAVLVANLPDRHVVAIVREQNDPAVRALLLRQLAERERPSTTALFARLAADGELSGEALAAMDARSATLIPQLQELLREGTPVDQQFAAVALGQLQTPAANSVVLDEVRRDGSKESVAWLAVFTAPSSTLRQTIFATADSDLRKQLLNAQAYWSLALASL